MKILYRKQIEKALSIPSVLQAIEQGFIAYSRGEAVIPPSGFLHFDCPQGDCHIKYGYIKSEKYYVVKIASGFYENPKHGLPSTNGLMLLFDQQTGALVCTLFDEGFLTNMRTAAAGSIAAKYLGPKSVTSVGIIGTGAQAYYQLKLLAFSTSCRKALIWGRDLEKAEKLAKHPDLSNWTIEATCNIEKLTSLCNLIVTTTASHQPILFADHIKPGTHITAVGADEEGKQELDESIFTRADQIIVDSRSQCSMFGDVSHAVKKGLIGLDKLVELGEVLENPSLKRMSHDQITVCDLTGIATQDLQIAKSIYETCF